MRSKRCAVQNQGITLSGGNIDKIHFYHSISPYHLFTLESLHLFVSISNFLGLLCSVHA